MFVFCSGCLELGIRLGTTNWKMDARDSSSSALGRDGFSDEEALTAGLAKEAEVMFQGRRFEECVEVLNQLLPKKGSDPKV